MSKVSVGSKLVTKAGETVTVIEHWGKEGTFVRKDDGTHAWLEPEDIA